MQNPGGPGLKDDDNEKRIDLSGVCCLDDSGRCECAANRRYGSYHPRAEKVLFTRPSLHRKIPFLTRISETGSTTGRGVGGSVPSSKRLTARLFPVVPSERGRDLARVSLRL
jgi:hypothetical protein